MTRFYSTAEHTNEQLQALSHANFSHKLCGNGDCRLCAGAHFILKLNTTEDHDLSGYHM